MYDNMYTPRGGARLQVEDAARITICKWNRCTGSMCHTFRLLMLQLISKQKYHRCAAAPLFKSGALSRTW